MSSLDRRRRKLAEKRAKVQGAKKTLDSLLFGSDAAPTQEMADERRALIARWRALMTEYGAKNATSLHAYLLHAFEKYDVDRDGQSVAMALVWDINTLKELEAEHAKAAGSHRLPS